MTERLGQWQTEHRVQELEKRQEEKELEQKAEIRFNDFNFVSVNEGGYCCVCQRCKKQFIGYKRQLFCDYCEKIGKLEKENAELKVENKKMRNCYNCRNYNYNHEYCNKTKLNDLLVCDKWEFEPV